MADRDVGPFDGMTRRAFLKTAAVAGAALTSSFQIAYDAEKVFAYENDPVNYKVSTTTCPYCSASCGQRVVTALTGPDAGQVVDIYGDFESPFNSGGLCAKGAGSLQLVNNKRRVGAYTDAHPEHAVFAADGTTDKLAYKRIEGTHDWQAMPLATALGEIATGMVAARGTVTDAGGYNSQSVAFFGSSHLNNEQNYLYRRLIAQFGTTNTEHQARI